MKYTSTVISVADIKAARAFYEDLFGLELYQDYGINISFTCGLALQQDFDWLVHLPKEKILKKPNNMEICFEEHDFDGFLDKLKKNPDIEYLGEVIEHNWGQRVIRFPQFFYVLRTSRYLLGGSVCQAGMPQERLRKSYSEKTGIYRCGTWLRTA